MKSVRVVQITDLHILPEAGQMLVGIDSALSLDKVLDDIRRLSPSADLIIASGDLTDNGSAKSYQRLQALLNQLDCPVYVLAGNHDEVDVMQSELVAGNIFFQRYLDCEYWKLIFVNTKNEGDPHGLIDKNEIEWLKGELEKSAQRPVLLIMHHTPLKLCASPSCRLENADELLDLLSRFENVRAVIAGHTHNDVEETHGQLRIMTTPSTMVQVWHNQEEAINTNDGFWHFHKADLSRHGYRVLDLYDDGDFMTEVRWVAASQAISFAPTWCKKA